MTSGSVTMRSWAQSGGRGGFSYTFPSVDDLFRAAVSEWGFTQCDAETLIRDGRVAYRGFIWTVNRAATGIEKHYLGNRIQEAPPTAKAFEDLLTPDDVALLRKLEEAFA